MSEKKSFWSTLPGIFTGAAAFITALGSLFVVLFQIGVIGDKDGTTSQDSIQNDFGNAKYEENIPIVDNAPDKKKVSEKSGSSNYKPTPKELNPVTNSPKEKEEPKTTPPEPKDPVATVNPPDVMNISGDWLTPGKGLSYKIIQNGADYSWTIPGTALSGTGKIEDEKLVSILEGQKVVYNVTLWDDDGNPLLLTTLHPRYATVALFRNCSDFKKFVKNTKHDFPEVYLAIEQYLKTLPNPTCPDALEN